MKTKHILFSIIGVAVLFAIGFFGATLFRKVTNKQVVNQKPAEEQIALVSPVSSQVFISGAREVTTFSEIQTPTQINQGDHVKTSATGRALIEGKNTTILDSNSEIVFTTFDQTNNQTKIQINAGQIWSRVKKLSDKGEYYEIETQNAHVSVRGTSFGLKTIGQDTTLTVTDGLVRFVPVDKITKQEITSKEVFVPGGKKAVIYGSLAPQVQDLTNPDISDAWYIYNNSVVVSDSQTPNSQLPTPSVSISPTPNSQLPTPSESSASGSGTSSSSGTLNPVVVNPAAPVSSSPIIVQESPTTPPKADQPLAGNKTISPGTPDSPELLLSSITPQTIISSARPIVTLKGFGFQKSNVKSISIGRFAITNFQIISDNVITFTLGSGQIEQGVYDVSVIGSSNNSSTISNGLTVTLR